MEKTVNTTNTKDKGKKLQKQILQNEKCMKKKDNVRSYKDIENHPHTVTSCQIYKEYETSIPEPNNVNQDKRTRLNEVRGTSDLSLRM